MFEQRCNCINKLKACIALAPLCAGVLFSSVLSFATADEPSVPQSGRSERLFYQGAADNSEAISGRQGQEAVVILSKQSTVLHPLSDNCSLLMAMTPCQFSNSGRIATGAADAAVMVEDEAVWAVVNTPEGEMTAPDSRQHVPVIRVLDGTGNFVLKNEGTISAPGAGKTAIDIGQRSVMLYPLVSSGFREFIIENSGRMEAQTVISLQSSGRMTLQNQGVINGNIFIQEDDDVDEVLMSGRGHFNGEVRNIERFIINNATESTSQAHDRDEESSKYRDAAVFIRGSIDFHEVKERPQLLMSEGSLVIVESLLVRRGDVVIEGDVDLILRVTESNRVTRTKPGSSSGKTKKAVLEATGGSIRLDHSVRVQVDLNEVNLDQPAEFLLMASGQSVSAPSVHADPLETRLYDVKTIKKGQYFIIQVSRKVAGE